MRGTRLSAAVCLLFAFGSAGTAAQWLNYKTPGVPRARDGKPKLDAPAPRAVDGHVDLTGVWMHDLTPDGRTLPSEVNLPAYFGYSVGRWQRDAHIAGNH